MNKNITDYGVQNVQSGTILSGVSLDIYIDNLIEHLEYLISPATSRIVSYESAQLYADGKTVYAKRKDGHKAIDIAVAQFLSPSDAKTFVENNSDRARSAAHTQLSILKKFREARKNGDIEAQKKIFEGLYLATSINLGEAEARTLRANCDNLVRKSHLQKMVDAILAGWNKEDEVRSRREQPASNVESGGVEASRASYALYYLLEEASKDGYVQKLKNDISDFLIEYKSLLRNVKDSDNTKKINDIDNLLEIFTYLTLMPKSVEKIEEKLRT